VAHHVIEIDVLVDDGTVAHVIVDELSFGDALAALVAMYRVAVCTAVSKVVDERPQHLLLCPVAVCELGMLDVVVRRLYMVVTANIKLHIR